MKQFILNVLGEKWVHFFTEHSDDLLNISKATMQYFFAPVMAQILSFLGLGNWLAEYGLNIDFGLFGSMGQAVAFIMFRIAQWEGLEKPSPLSNGIQFTKFLFQLSVGFILGLVLTPILGDYFKGYAFMGHPYSLAIIAFFIGVFSDLGWKMRKKIANKIDNINIKITGIEDAQEPNTQSLDDGQGGDGPKKPQN